MLRPALLALLLLAPFVSGCLAVAAAGVVGAGVVQYGRNEVTQDFPLDLSAAWQATLEGLKRLEIAPEQSELGPTEGRIAHQDLVILVERHPEGFARVRVRVGTFFSRDHERRARLVLQEIEGAIERRDELRVWSEKVQGLPQPQATPPPQPKS
ncbi:MAG: DUF3568 family protein [Planctomycetes bacterium]|nr:DUF3568 family protein [Planctomycetota bacterium]